MTIETTDRAQVAELRAEYPDEPILLKEPRSVLWLLFQPGEQEPQRVAARRKARYADGLPRPY